MSTQKNIESHLTFKTKTGYYGSFSKIALDKNALLDIFMWS